MTRLVCRFVLADGFKVQHFSSITSCWKVFQQLLVNTRLFENVIVQ